jgi:hypothetical protein
VLTYRNFVAIDSTPNGKSGVTLKPTLLNAVKWLSNFKFQKPFGKKPSTIQGKWNNFPLLQVVLFFYFLPLPFINGIIRLLKSLNVVSGYISCFFE